MSLPSTYVEGFHDKSSVIKMQYSFLGNTGLKVSKLSIGGGPLCNTFYSNYNEDEVIETIREAIKKGINYIDTAPYYGQGKSESVLGKALRDVPRSAYYIATKIGRYELECANMFDFSREKTIESVNKSLQLLGLDYVDIIQVHDIEFSKTLCQILDETLPALNEIRNDNKAKFIGVTGYPVSILKEAVKGSPIPINTILSYARNTLIDTELNSYMPFFQMEGIGVICASNLSMGLLTNSGPPHWHPATNDIKNICSEASEYCKSNGVELGRLALWSSMAQNNAATFLVGMNTRHQLQLNLSVMYEGLNEIEQNALKELKQRYFANMNNTNWEGIEVANYWRNISESEIMMEQ